MPLRRQSDNYQEWLEEETDIAGQELLAEDFSRGTTVSSEWRFAVFHSGVSPDDPAAEIREKWAPLDDVVQEDGLELKQIVIKALPEITLRSLAVEVQVTIRLQGESSFWICTRGAGIRDPNTAICLISKEINSHRTFISIGGPIGNQQEFKFFKKTEIPEQQATKEALLEDWQDIVVNYFDNGDDKISVSAYIAGKSKKYCYLKSDKFIPWLHPTNLLLAGSGTSTV